MRTVVGKSLHVLVGLLLPLSTAAASGWEKMPSGEWQFVDRVSTTGFFTCGSPTEYRAVNACSANGSTLVLRSGSSELTVTFAGLVQTIMSSNVRSAPIAMGTLSTAITGGPFTMPAVTSDQGTLFTFTLLLNAELGGTGRVTAGYTASAQTSLPYNCCENFFTYVRLGTSAQPAGLTYSSSLYDNFAGRDIAFDGSSSLVTARVGLIPEPSTYLLLATGLVGVAWLTKRRRAA